MSEGKRARRPKRVVVDVDADPQNAHWLKRPDGAALPPLLPPGAAPAPAPPLKSSEPIPITDEDVRRAREAAKAWDDPAVKRMMREMERRRKQIQQEKGTE